MKWRQTGQCSRDPEHDKNCNVELRNVSSGYCECLLDPRVVDIRGYETTFKGGDLHFSLMKGYKTTCDDVCSLLSGELYYYIKMFVLLP